MSPGEPQQSPLLLWRHTIPSPLNLSLSTAFLCEIHRMHVRDVNNGAEKEEPKQETVSWSEEEETAKPQKDKAKETRQAKKNNRRRWRRMYCP